MQVIREHPRQPNLLFVGTEFGVFFSAEGGNHWVQLKGGLPPVPVHDIAIQPRFNDLVLGTHGRGIWILDDLTPLEHLARAKQATNVFLYPVLDVAPARAEQQPEFRHGNPWLHRDRIRRSVRRIAYLVRDIAADAKVSLEILNSAGTVVRVLPVNRNPGLYRTNWDMRVGAPLTGPIDVCRHRRGGAGSRRPRWRGGGRGGGGGFGGRGGCQRRSRDLPRAAGELQGAPHHHAEERCADRAGAELHARCVIPIVPLTTADLKTLYDYRLDLARFQRTVRDAQARVDTIQRTLADVKRAAESANDAASRCVEERTRRAREGDDRHRPHRSVAVGAVVAVARPVPWRGAWAVARAGGRGGRGRVGGRWRGWRGATAAVSPVVEVESTPPVTPPATPSPQDHPGPARHDDRPDECALSRPVPSS